MAQWGVRENSAREKAMTTWLLQNPTNYRKLTLQRLDFLEGGRKWEKDKELGGLLKKTILNKNIKEREREQTERL